MLARTPEPILEPEFPYETEGFYSHCVFPAGNVVVDGVLYVYYGGADKYVGVATCRVGGIIKLYDRRSVAVNSSILAARFIKV